MSYVDIVVTQLYDIYIYIYIYIYVYLYLCVFSSREIFVFPPIFATAGRKVPVLRLQTNTSQSLLAGATAPMLSGLLHLQPQRARGRLGGQSP